jgi:hypothetical protein
VIDGDLIRELTAERDAMKAELTRLQDVAQYANAIGQIEAALGIAGKQPLSETVAGVEWLKADLVAERKLSADVDRLTGENERLRAEAVQNFAACVVNHTKLTELRDELTALTTTWNEQAQIADATFGAARRQLLQACAIELSAVVAKVKPRA